MPRPPLVLGLNADHADAAVCLMAGGEVMMAVEEERLSRVKHHHGFPHRALAAVLSGCGVAAREVRAVAINRDPRARRRARALHVLRFPSSVALRRQGGGGAPEGTDPLAGVPRRPVEHHLAHLWSAFWPSPFEEAALLSVDGSGDFTTTCWGYGRGREVRPLGGTRFPHSLGLFYTAVTQHLGFGHYGDEYKVMGLSAYGEPRFAPALRALVPARRHGQTRLVLRYFRHHREPLARREGGCAPHYDAHFSPRIVELLGPPRKAGDPLEERHADLAASAQLVYEERLLHVLRHLRERTGARRLCLAGGCAQNSLANARVAERAGFEALWVPSSPGDAGGAMGAAMAVAAEFGASREPLRRADLGPGLDEVEVMAAVQARWSALRAEGVRMAHLRPAELVEDVARLIARGHLVGWVQGRSEWGPRALGQRSILADPRRSSTRANLNRKIKKREDFRPLAPSVLAARADEWFTGIGDQPFMSCVFPVAPEQRSRVPAVTHADGTARPQVVRRADAPLYHALIAAFERISGVPMVVNTSFNVQEPIVQGARDALQTFESTRLDALALGDYLLLRPAARRTLETGDRASARLQTLR